MFCKQTSHALTALILTALALCFSCKSTVSTRKPCFSASHETLPAHPETGSVLHPEDFRRAAAWSAYARALCDMYRTDRKDAAAHGIHIARQLDPEDDATLREQWETICAPTPELRVKHYEPVYRADPRNIPNLIRFTRYLCAEGRFKRAKHLLLERFKQTGFRDSRLAQAYILYVAPKDTWTTDTKNLVKQLDSQPPETLLYPDIARTARAFYTLIELEKQPELDPKIRKQRLAECLERIDGIAPAALDVPSCYIIARVCNENRDWKRLHRYLLELKRIQHHAARTHWWLERFIRTAQQTGDNRKLLEHIEPIAPHLKLPDPLLRHLIKLCIEHQTPETIRTAAQIQNILIRKHPDALIEKIYLARILAYSQQPQNAAKILLALPSSALTHQEKLLRNQILEEIGDTRNAYRFYAESLAQTFFAHQPAPLPPSFYYRFAMLCIRMNKLEQARELAAQSHRLAPDNPLLCNFYGYLLADSGQQLDLALTLIQKAVQAQPRNIAFIDSLAWVQFKRGDLKAALSAMADLLQHNPLTDEPDPEILTHLNQIFRAIGMTLSAKLYLVTETAH